MDNTEIQKNKPSYLARGAVIAFVAVLIVSGLLAMKYFIGNKTYTSSREGIKFTYPKSWHGTTPNEKSGDHLGDAFSLKSPSGNVEITWVSSVSDLSGGCTLSILDKKTPQCVNITIVSKDDVPGIKGLSVFSGTTTTDYKNYRPWFAVQETKNPMLKEGLGLNFDAFRLVGQKPQRNSLAVFSTSGIKADGPKMSKDDAEKWFKSKEAKQAKKILLSLTFLPQKDQPKELKK